MAKKDEKKAKIAPAKNIPSEKLVVENESTTELAQSTTKLSARMVTLGITLTVEPSENFHPFNEIGNEVLLNNSTNSTGGKPTAGSGSGISSLMSISLIPAA